MQKQEEGMKNGEAERMGRGKGGRGGKGQEGGCMSPMVLLPYLSGWI